MGQHRVGQHGVGRHRKPAPQRKRGAVVAMAFMVPASLLTVAATTRAAYDHASTPTAGAVQVGLAGAEVNTAAPGPTTASPAPAAQQEQAPAAGAAAPAAKPAPAPPTPAAPAPVSNAPQDGIPGIAFDAYHKAEQALAQQDPGCGLSWTLLAGIGRIESHHGFNGQFDQNGTMLQPIYGPSLDGSLPGNEVITDGNGYARAEGPMQFMPTTWAAYAAPGANPQNIYDAALTAGKYLCSAGANLRDIGGQTQAILRYNHSMAYVANVLAWSVGYSTGIAPVVESLPKI